MNEKARNKLNPCYKKTLAFQLKLAIDKRRLLLGVAKFDDAKTCIANLNEFDKSTKENNVRRFVVYVVCDDDL